MRTSSYIRDTEASLQNEKRSTESSVLKVTSHIVAYQKVPYTQSQYIKPMNINPLGWKLIT